MSLLKRLGGIVSGARKAAANSWDATWDVASAAWSTDDEDDSFFEHVGHFISQADLLTPTVYFGGQRPRSLDADVRRALDKQRKGGTLTTLTGGALRNVGSFAYHSVADPISVGLDTLNTAYREGVAEPISTALTFGSLLDDPEFNKRVAGKSWLDKAKTAFDEADEIAEHRSPGQALMLAILTDSVTDDTELAEATDTEAYHWLSGITDAGLQLYADPTARVSKTVRAFREARDVVHLAELARLGENSRAGEGIASFVRKTVDDVGVERAPAVVRDRLFPSRTSRAGDMVSSLLVEASQRRKGELDLVLKTFAGNADAFRTLDGRATTLADVTAQAMEGMREYVDVVPETTFEDITGMIHTGRQIITPGANTYGEVAFNLASDAAMRANEELTRTENLRDLWGVWAETPQLTRRGALRTAYTKSNLYQSSPLSRPLRVINQTLPRRALNIHAPNLDVDIARAMQEVGAPQHDLEFFRSNMLNAYTSGQRRAVIQQTNEYIVGKLVDDLGLTPEKADEFRAEITRLRGEANKIVNTAYTGDDGITRIIVKDRDGLVTHVKAPSLTTQYANYEWLPNTRKLRYLAEKVAADKAVHVGAITDNTLSLFYEVWKPLTLLGIRTPIRVGTDEMARRIADYRAIAVGYDIGKQLAAKVGIGTRAGEETVEGLARTYAPAFGEQGDNLARQAVKETARPGGFYGRGERGIFDDNVGVRDWRSLPATKVKEYDAAWNHDVRRQIAQAPLARRLLETGMDREGVVEWLKSADGYRVLRATDEAYRFDPEGWVDDVAAQIEYLLPTPKLQQDALGGSADIAEFFAHYGGRESAPPIHLQFMRDTFNGKSSIVDVLRKTSDELMSRLNSTPTVFLQREPHFARKYAEEVRRLDRLATERGLPLTDELATTFEKRARAYALEQVRDLLFDMNETSALAESMRFVAPFANASREVVTRWAGITWRRPETIRRLQQVWQSPRKAGLEIDGNGNEIIGDGWARTPDGKRVRAEGETFLRIQIPAGLPLPKSLRAASGAVRFSKDSFNTIIGNPFGVGPTATVAASYLLRDKPELQESVKFLFPFGVPASPLQAVMPTTLRRITTTTDDQSYMALKGYYFNTLAADWAQDGRQLDEGETVDDHMNKLWTEAEATARTMRNIRIATSYLSPVQPNFTSPYQAYIDIYRRYARKDPETAEMRMIDEYGTELVSLYQSVTKTVNGIPPTLEGWKAYKEHKALVDRDPELGRIIIGEVGGEFNRAVYQHQLKTGARRYKTKDELVEQPDVDAGWNAYTKFNDALDAEMEERGLTSLRPKRAAQLNEAKKEFIADLKAQYPAWARDYDEKDFEKTNRRIEALRRVVVDPQLRDRDDMRGIAAYIALRDQALAALKERRTGNIESPSNRRILDVWENERAMIVRRYITFAPIFHRYFENDMPRVG